MAQVVIIDDDPAFASSLRAILAHDHKVTIFPEVPADLDQLLSLNPDLVFLDCMLPGESGPALLNRLRVHELGSRLQVVLTSAHHEMIHEANGMAGEYEEFLKKPCTMRQVLAVVRRRLPAASRA